MNENKRAAANDRRAEEEKDGKARHRPEKESAPPQPTPPRTGMVEGGAQLIWALWS